MGFIQKIADPADFSGHRSGKAAADASLEGSRIAADAQRESLAYLKEREALPQEIREESLTGLSDFYQVPDRAKTQEQLIEEARQSPLYDAILGSREAGEEAILRNASATGGLRSGGTIGNLTDYNQQLENQALLESFNQARQRDDYQRQLHLSGLSGLAGLDSYAPQIAETQSSIGMTQGQGVTGAAQARLQAEQGGKQNLMALAGLAAMAFCDLRLKDNIRFKGFRNGFAWYEWDWIPEASKIGLEGKSEGVIAHQVYETHPDAVGEAYGFLTVDYNSLGLEAA